jgi:hypothetical protein
MYRGLSLAQARLAEAENVKIRFGFLSSAGEQKGVDSLIVTDLIDLARNRAICDAVLMSGDEDVRIAVQVAQSYGVRVHLLGIEPSRGNQSKQLRQEADTLTEWSSATITKFLIIRKPSAPSASSTKPGASSTTTPAAATAASTPAGLAASPSATAKVAKLPVPDKIEPKVSAALDSVATEFVGSLTEGEIMGISRVVEYRAWRTI